MLEVEDWTQPSHSKRRISSRRTTGDNESSDGFQTSYSKLSPSALPPPGPPETGVEDTFLLSHPPKSHLFLAGSRTSSSPPTRPSSLSRLLAQASASPDGISENLPPPDLIPDVKSRTPSLSPPPPPSPTNNAGSAPHSHNNVPSVSSPLRPGSRASRLSTTSRFSVGRIPALPTATASQPKASATTALTEQAVASSASSNDGSPFESPVTPFPEQPLPEVAGHRRGTSYHNPRPSPLASSSSQSTVVPSKPASTASDTLATLANSWGMPFGRKKKADLGNLAPAVEFPNIDDAKGNTQRHTIHNISAHDLLKRL
jgi:autophagy-related protein 11